MQAQNAEINVMVCLPSDEEQAEAVLAAATQLARDLNAAICVVEVYPDGSHDRRQTARQSAPKHRANSWHLQSDDPIAPLLKFAEQHRITHIVFGQSGWRRWGNSLSDAGEASGRLALSWLLTGAAGGCRGLTFESS